MPTNTLLTHSLQNPLTVVALGLWAAGCLLVESTSSPDAAVTADAAISLTSVQRGALVAQKNGCGSCHNSENPGDEALSGQLTVRPGTMAYGANLTPDKATGIGDWTDDDIITAVRIGIDDKGQPLCNVMPRFTTMELSEARDLVAYLHSLKAVHRAIPDSKCPPVKP